MTSLLQDLRFAVRGLMRAPAFTLVALATLAIGIGANTAIFSVVDGVVLRPLPFPDSDRLVLVEKTRPDGARGNVSWPDFVDWREGNQVFAGIAGYHGDSVVVTSLGDRPLRLDAMAVTASYLDVLGVRPALGRDFAAGEDREGHNRVAILGHETWKRHLGGDPAAVGRTLTVDGEPHTVVGVLPPGFRSFTDTRVELLVPKPRAFDRDLAELRGAHYMDVVARLRPGVSLAAAGANLGAIGARLAAAYPDSNAGRGVAVTRLQDRLTEELRPALLILLGAVGFVLLIACANVANLLLARASVRHRELAIRVALGAGRGRVVRQMLTESVLLSLVGGGLGVLLALWGLDALQGALPEELARFPAVVADGRVLAFTFGVALLVGLAFGLVPALQASSSNPSDALKEATSRSTAHAGRARARSVLVAAEVALATLLLVGAGLMLRSFQRVGQVDPGFRPDDLVTGVIVLPATRYDDDARVVDFYRRFKEQLAAVPGAATSSIGVPLPFSGMSTSFVFDIAGAPPLPPGQRNVAQHFAVSPDFFATMGIPLRAGRTFSAAEDSPRGPPAIIVSEGLARTYLGEGSPIGRKLVLGRGEDRVEREIVGVVGDVRVGSLEAPALPQMYVPFAHAPWTFVGWVARTRATAGLAEAVQAAVAAVDKDQPLGDLDTMAGLMRDSLAGRRLNTLLLSIFGGVAVLLALIGVYGVMSYTVTQRVPEIGIRMALGARPADVTRMVVGHGLILAVAGVLLGLGGAVALARVLESLLFGVSATDPAIYAGIAALLVAVAALASWLPARRAAKVDPMIALRSE